MALNTIDPDTIALVTFDLAFNLATYLRENDWSETLKRLDVEQTYPPVLAAWALEDRDDGARQDQRVMALKHATDVLLRKISHTKHLSVENTIVRTLMRDITAPMILRAAEDVLQRLVAHTAHCNSLGVVHPKPR